MGIDEKEKKDIESQKEKIRRKEMGEQNKKNSQNKKDKDFFGGKDGGLKPGKNMAFLVVILLLGFFFLYLFSGNQGTGKLINYSEFLGLVDDENIKWREIKFIDRNIIGDFEIREEVKDQRSYVKYEKHRDNRRGFYQIQTHSPLGQIDSELIKSLRARNIEFNSEEPSNNYVMTILTTVIPWLLIFGVLWFVMFRQIQGTGNKALLFGKSRAKLVKLEQKKVTFKDVAGIDEVREELIETVDFLKDPEKFKKLGAKIPRGVLLVGSPGTGKTLLARAVAGEADRPFFSMSGSEFVEMFVGVGASRVRDLFEKGRKNAPCIIFIDELDAVGRMRGAGYGGGHDEREQTLNQMLVEMDGFDTEKTVIVMAATNRPDVLDPALLRPGRFDRKVMVNLPTLKGREEILGIHIKNIPCSSGVDMGVIAKGTPGFSGADLANLVNESALIAARNDRKKVMMEDFEYAKDKVMMGPERKTVLMSEREKINTAYHESGHALLAYMLDKVNTLYKVSIIPRGSALGITQLLPLEERYTMTKSSLLEEMTVLFGGRIGEEYKFGVGNITNGASNDLERITRITHLMVCEWGMSEKVGPLTIGRKEEPVFLGKEIARSKDYSDKTAETIDREIKAIIDHCCGQARKMILENTDKLEILAKNLLEKEVLDRNDIELILGGKREGEVEKEPEKESKEA